MTSATTLRPGADLGPENSQVAVARSAVSQALGSGQWCRSDRDLVDDLRETLALRAQVDALLLAQIAEADSRGIPARRGCPSTRAWLRSAHRIAPGEASSLLRAALALREELPAVGAALACGELSLEQAKVCVHAIADLPAATPIAKRPQAEATMIDSARSFDPVLLARIGRRLAEIIDPEGVQARDEQPIHDHEADAYQGRDLTLTPSRTGAGGTLRAKLDATGYATLAAYLTAASAPHVTPDGTVTAHGTVHADGIPGNLRPAGAPAPTPADSPWPFGSAGGSGTSTDGDSAVGVIGGAATAVDDTRTVGQRRHDALVEAVRQALAVGGLPTSGGVKPRIVITIPWTSLKNRTGAGRLSDGSLISPSLTRQLADDAEIVPVWLSPTGVPLDIGRLQRLFTGRIRTALETRDRGCAWPGCDRPPSWTQAHHIRSWLEGGKTDLINGVLLCLYHHHEIDKADWTVTIRNGRAWFTPPRWIDPQQKPILNLLHHPPPRE